PLSSDLVANFTVKNLEDLAMVAKVSPAVNQIELHPYFARWKEVDAGRVHGTKVESWGPLAQNKTDLLENEDIVAAAEAHGKTPAQVVLRWHLQNNVIVFPKTSLHRACVRTLTSSISSSPT